MSLRRFLPGLAVLCLGALLARSVELAVGLNHLLVAIAIGFVLANAVGVPTRFERGIATHKLWLGAGIVLMGASLTLETVLEVGGLVLLVVVAITALTIVVVELLARNVFGLADHLGSLLAAGSGICGVSAVVAVAGAIRAREGQIAYAAATVLLFDAITLVVYPIVGDALGLSSVVFGVWAGVSMFSTGPVVAVGFAHSEVAGQWATMTKLSRNALIGVVVLAYASYYARTGSAGRPSLRSLWEEFPKFVLGFLALVALASLGAFSPAQQASIENAYSWLFLLAFVGLGTEIRLAELRNTGVAPALVVLLALLVASTVSLGVLTLLFGA
ncbi:YeiH family protein [Natrononativus amylolyticus]|uniref:YeiH family protein n=1 Tax=Natrononativus amylolyticus TaxID=2963434 RepID=UPI0020CD5504|nr:putative sulfate exporter family transporter [Natrononativus amylolyticus]